MVYSEMLFFTSDTLDVTARTVEDSDRVFLTLKCGGDTHRFTICGTWQDVDALLSSMATAAYEARREAAA